MAHLKRAGIDRRRLVRKLTDHSVAVAPPQYEAGASLTVVASAFGVHAVTDETEAVVARTPVVSAHRVHIEQAERE